MMAYYLRAADFGLMYIEYKEEVLASLKYKNWSPSKATVAYPKTVYTFNKTNFFGTKRQVLKNGQPFGKLQIARGVTINLFSPHEDSDTIYLKSKGFFHNSVEVYLNETHILTMHPEYTWVKASYKIEIIDKNRTILPIEELLGLLGYAIRFYSALGHA